MEPTRDMRRRTLWEKKAELLAAAGHPLRVAILDYLRNGEKCVCQIVSHLGEQQSNVSRHLAVLLRAGLVQHRKQGLKMIYSLSTPCILQCLDCLTRILREQACRSQTMLKMLKEPV